MKEQIHGGDIYRHPDAIDFSSNINPLGTPESVIEAACKSIRQIAGYPDILYTGLRAALKEYEGVREDMIICGNGAAELIFSLVLAVKPKKALLPVPTFAEYEQALTAAGCQVRHYRMDDSYQLHENFLKEITREYDILFLCNPNNPTGFVIPPEFMRAIMTRCREKGVFLVIDECFQDFLADPGSYSMKTELEKNSQFFILKAFTKRYAMAGIRLGYGLCSSEQLLERMNGVTQPWNVSIPAQAAGIAALQETSYVERARILVQQENEFLKKELSKMHLEVFDSKANYIFFKGPEDLYQSCLQQNILIRDCSNYPGLEKGFYRIAVRTHEENLQLLRVFEAVLQDDGGA